MHSLNPASLEKVTSKTNSSKRHGEKKKPNSATVFLVCTTAPTNTLFPKENILTKRKQKKKKN